MSNRAISSPGVGLSACAEMTSLFSVQHWRIWLGTLCGVSIAAAIVIYAISEFIRRREAPTPTLTAAS